MQGKAAGRCLHLIQLRTACCPFNTMARKVALLCSSNEGLLPEPTRGYTSIAQLIPAQDNANPELDQLCNFIFYLHDIIFCHLLKKNGAGHCHSLAERQGVIKK